MRGLKSLRPLKFDTALGLTLPKQPVFFARARTIEVRAEMGWFHLFRSALACTGFELSRKQDGVCGFCDFVGACSAVQLFQFFFT